MPGWGSGRGLSLPLPERPQVGGRHPPPAYKWPWAQVRASLPFPGHSPLPCGGSLPVPLSVVLGGKTV